MTGDNEADGLWQARESARAPEIVGKATIEGAEFALYLRVVGIVAGWDARGRNALPRGRKAQAILVFLAISGDGEVSRKRLTSLLWSRRWVEQARASLRQSLLELRRALDVIDPTLLTIDRNDIRLDCSRVKVQGLDWRRFPPARHSNGVPGGRLLESLRGLDPAFDRWIDQQALSVAPDLQAATRSGGRHSGIVASVAETWWRRDGGDTPILSQGASGDRSAIATIAAPPVHSARLSVSAQVLMPSHPSVSIRIVAAKGATGLPDHVGQVLERALLHAGARYSWFDVSRSETTSTTRPSYRLELSVSPDGESWTLTGRLRGPGIADATWSFRRRVPGDAPLAHGVEVGEQVLLQLANSLAELERDRVRLVPPDKCSAHDLCALAFGQAFDTERSSWTQSMSRLSLAIARSPDHARSYALSAAVRGLGICRGLTEGTDLELETIRAMTLRALHIDPSDSTVHAFSSLAGLVAAGGAGDGTADCRKAFERNPNCGVAWAINALLLGGQGQEAQARAHLFHAAELMPCLQNEPLLTQFEQNVADLQRHIGRRGRMPSPGAMTSTPVVSLMRPASLTRRESSVTAESERHFPASSAGTEAQIASAKARRSSVESELEMAGDSPI